MTFLPIVSRELRVASRRRWTYWGRFTACLLAILGATAVFLASDKTTPQYEIGAALFGTLATLIFIYIAFAGTQLTCDCLSTERREGTLGLLFLTDLRGYDVVLGKLAATSLTAAYSILAVLPVLAVPLVLGGVTHAEVWRVALVSANLLFFFLAVGMFSSSVCREDHRALALSIFISVATVMASPLIATWLDQTRHRIPLPDWFWGLPCPAFGCIAAFDGAYTRQIGWRAAFWWNAILTQLYSWFWLLLACRIVRHSWKESTAGPRRGKWRDRWRAFFEGSAAARAAVRRKLLAVNPFLWRAGRSRGARIAPWAFLAVAAALWFVSGKLFRNHHLLDEPNDLLCLAAVLFVLKVWVASEAGRCLGEDRRSGALELLLTTPLGAEEIVRGQRKALWRQFFGPMAFVLLLNCLFLHEALRHETDHENRQGFVIYYLLMAAFLVLDTYAMSWLSMRLALSGRKPIRVIMLSLWWTVFLPGLLSLGLIIVCVIRDEIGNFDFTPLMFGLIWGIPSLAADLIVIAAGRINILTRFRGEALGRAGTSRPARPAR
jgi:ABC-type transport system involved in multi-copper enzyme maturation permease subunit